MPKHTTSAEGAGAIQHNFVIATEPEICLFTGQGHRELELFLADIEYAFKTRPDWNLEIQSLRIWRALGEKVQTELRCQGLSKTSTPAEIRRALQRTYGDRRSVHRLVTTFQSMSQEGFEDISSYSQRLYRAFEHLKDAQKREGVTQMDNGQLVSKFIDGIQDPVLRMHLRQKKETDEDISFASLRDYAKKIRGDDVENQVDTQARVQAVHTNSKDDVTERLLKMMERMETRLEKLENESNRPQRQPAGRRGPKCYRCEGWGHLANDCATGKSYGTGAGENWRNNAGQHTENRSGASQPGNANTQH